MVRKQERRDAIAEEVQEYRRKLPYTRYLEAELGLRNHWYPALFSHEVKEGETNATTIGGERLFFKRVGGQVYCIEDRCAHRGVKFSAKPEVYSRNTITCWFHGFCYDVRDGKLVSVLSEPDSSVVGKIYIKTYHVIEENNMAFVFIGDMDPLPPLKEDTPPVFWLPNIYVRPLTRYFVKSNWRLGTENGFDLGHAYIHRNWAFAKEFGKSMTLGSSIRSKDEIVLVEEPGGPKGMYLMSTVTSWVGEVEGVKVRSIYVDPEIPPESDRKPNVEFGSFLPCGLQVPAFPRRDIRHLEWYVPIDEYTHYYFVAQAVVCESEEERRTFDREAEERVARVAFTEDPTAYPFGGDGPNPGGFTNADIFLREEQEHAYAREDWWHRERLYKADYAVIQWRMMVHKHARGIQKWGDFGSSGSD